MDYSWAMIHSTCLAFNKFTFFIYHESCRETITNNEELHFTTVLHLCSAHVMHRISYNIGKKFKLDKKVKKVILHVFGRMLTSKNILEIYHLFELLCFVLCCEKSTNDIKNILL